MFAQTGVSCMWEQIKKVGDYLEYKKFEWHDTDNMFSVYQAYEEGKPEYPVIYPEGGNRSAHLYINRYEDTHRVVYGSGAVNDNICQYCLQYPDLIGCKSF